MYVSRLALQNWRNFKQAEGAFGARTFIIGPNASGKSNLLDALRFLRDVAAIGLRQSVLDKRGDVSALRCLAATYRSDVQIEVTLVEGDGPDAGAGWRYRLAFNKDHRQEQPVIRCERVWHGEELLVERPNEEDRSDPERLTQTYLEQINANRGFRELAEFFRSIAYRHPVPEVIRDPKGFSSAPVINDPYGRDFLQRLWQTPQRTREARLRRINQVLQVAVPQFRELRVEQDETGTPHLVGLYEHWRPNAARQSEAQFSDGTLRLLGLLWALLEDGGPLLLEEPELSLHAAVVAQLPGLFERARRRKGGGRQVIVTTHSEDLLRDPGIAAEEVLWLRPTAQGTLIHQPGDKERLLMQQGMSAADAVLPLSRPDGAEQLALALAPS
ncbi:MAG TPA: AAA family ATPase [Plasticicumulans sp.]|uniref:AAA family ATPase n=1 Tax=Plasticicumulans sp. TaxID=2307179 RepID=UPI002BC905F0|nr:AAA family ATPase [Plasticicumulans sp.]